MRTKERGLQVYIKEWGGGYRAGGAGGEGYIHYIHEERDARKGRATNRIYKKIIIIK